LKTSVVRGQDLEKTFALAAVPRPYGGRDFRVQETSTRNELRTVMIFCPDILGGTFRRDA
jgi:hypothetical protein